MSLYKAKEAEPDADARRESPFDSGGKDSCDAATGRDFQVASCPWKLDEGSKESLLAPLEGEWSQRHVGFGPLVSHESVNFCCFKPQVWGVLFGSRRKLIQTTMEK